MNLEKLLELLFVFFAALLRLLLVNENGQSVRTLPLKHQVAETPDSLSQEARRRPPVAGEQRRWPDSSADTARRSDPGGSL